MANALYDFGRNAFLLGDIDWYSDNISMLMIDGTNSNAAYKHDTQQDVDEYLVNITDGGIVANKGTDYFASKTPEDSTTANSTAGVADAANVTFTAVSQANSQHGDELVIYQALVDSGSIVEATSRLLVNIDNATGLPVTPNSGDITVQWDSGSNKIFKL